MSKMPPEYLEAVFERLQRPLEFVDHTFLRMEPLHRLLFVGLTLV